jgi:hypothetical protein
VDGTAYVHGAQPLEVIDHLLDLPVAHLVGAKRATQLQARGDEPGLHAVMQQERYLVAHLLVCREQRLRLGLSHGERGIRAVDLLLQPALGYAKQSEHDEGEDSRAHPREDEVGRGIEVGELQDGSRRRPHRHGHKRHSDGREEVPGHPSNEAGRESPEEPHGDPGYKAYGERRSHRPRSRLEGEGKRGRRHREEARQQSDGEGPQRPWADPLPPVKAISVRRLRRHDA